jgi:hypothetical protein
MHITEFFFVATDTCHDVEIEETNKNGKHFVVKAFKTFQRNYCHIKNKGHHKVLSLFHRRIMGKGAVLSPTSAVAPEPLPFNSKLTPIKNAVNEVQPPANKPRSFRDVSKIVQKEAVVTNAFRDKVFDKKTEGLIQREKSNSAQRLGRDVVQQHALLSELRHTAPITFFINRLLYRTEAALESVENRVYALFCTVILMLIVSVVAFLTVLFFTKDEFKHLHEDSNGYDDDGGGGGDDTVHNRNENVFLFATWITWSCFVDPGFHTEIDPFRYKWGRMIAAFISLLGILFFSFVLGFVVELMQSFIARVTEGRSSVIESGHYLILGYSEKCVAVISELAMAMDSDGGGVVVVLADYPSKAEFDILVNTRLHSLGLKSKTNVVFRPGSPLMTTNLLKVLFSYFFFFF